MRLRYIPQNSRQHSHVLRNIAAVTKLECPESRPYSGMGIASTGSRTTEPLPQYSAPSELKTANIFPRIYSFYFRIKAPVIA